MTDRPSVFIHAGMHKTGTSSTQAALYAGRDALIAQGIWYPPGGITEAATLLNVKRSDWHAERLDRALDAARRNGARTLILSLESVSTFAARDFRRLTAAMAGYDLTYLFVFRHWRRYLPSRWLQYVRRRDTQAFGAYIDRVVDDDHVDLRFDLVIRRAIESGRCRVKAISYDQAVEREHGVLAAIFRACGFDCGLQARLIAGSRWHHASLDPDIGEVLRLLNGVAAHRMGLPQDDNYGAVSTGRLMDVPFDLPVDAIPTSLMARIQELGRATPDRVDLSPVLAEASRRLTPFRHLFVELDDRPVFPVRTPQLSSSWSLEWPALAADAEVRSFVDPRLGAIAQRLATRRQTILRTDVAASG